MKRINWRVEEVLDRPGPLVVFIQMLEGEPEGDDVVRCVETGRSYTVTSLALGLGIDAMRAGRRGISLNASTEDSDLRIGMTLVNA
jgi:hypothetical protein